MAKVAFPRTLRALEARQLSRALDENMRYLETLLNKTFEMDHTRLSNVTSDQHHVKYTDAEVDTIVSTHTAVTDAHHTRYTDAEAASAANEIQKVESLDDIATPITGMFAWVSNNEDESLMYRYEIVPWSDSVGIHWQAHGFMDWEEGATVAAFDGRGWFGTHDDNLLDADTAHIHQSIGLWHDYAANLKNIVQSTALTPVFGDFHLSFQSVAAGGVDLINVDGLDTTPVMAEAIYEIDVSVASTNGEDIDVYLATYDVFGALIATGDPIGSIVAPTANTWYPLQGSRRTESDAVYGAILLLGNATAADETFYLDAVSLHRLGEDGQEHGFYPSLHIVGDLDASWMSTPVDVGEEQLMVGKWGQSTSQRVFQIRHDFQRPMPIIYVQIYNGTGYVNGGSLFEVMADERHEYRTIIDRANGKYGFAIDGGAVAYGGSGLNLTAVMVYNGLHVGMSETEGLSPFDGTYEWMTLRDGIDGPIVAHFDATIDHSDWINESPAAHITGQIATHQIGYGAVTDDKLADPRYTDAEALTAMGLLGDGNAYNHDKYLDADAVSAMGVLGDGNALNHTKFGATGWSNWSPSYTGISIGDGTVVARYKELDDIVVGHWAFTLGSTSTVTGSPRISTPVTVDTAYVDTRETVGTAYLFDATGLSYPAYVRLTTGLTDFQLLVESASGTYTSLANINGTVPFTWAVNDIMSFSFTFEKD